MHGDGRRRATLVMVEVMRRLDGALLILFVDLLCSCARLCNPHETQRLRRKADICLIQQTLKEKGTVVVESRIIQLDVVCDLLVLEKSRCVGSATRCLQQRHTIKYERFECRLR
jgi:hypothetical protein